MQIRQIKKKEYILILIFIVGLIIRIWPLFTFGGNAGIDSDIHISIAKHIAERGILESIFYPVEESSSFVNFGTLYKHPTFQLYPPLFHAIIALFGTVIGFALSAKIISSFFGALIVIPVYLIGKKWYNEDVGLIAAFLSTTAPDHVYYTATRVHPQSLGILLFSFSILIFYKAIVEKNKMSIVASILILLILILTYSPLAFWGMVIIILCVMLSDVKSLPKVFVIYTTTGFFSSFWLLKFLQHNPDVHFTFWWIKFWPPTNPLLTPFRVGIITVIASLYIMPLALKDLKQKTWLFVWISVFLILSFFMVTEPTPPSRYLTHLSIPLSILGGYGIWKFVNNNELTVKKLINSQIGKISLIFLCFVIFIVPNIFLVNALLINRDSVSPSSYEAYYWIADHVNEGEMILADADDITYWYNPTNFLSRSKSEKIFASADINESLIKNRITYTYIQKPPNPFFTYTPQTFEPIVFDKNILGGFPVAFHNEDIIIYNTSILWNIPRA
ncbi:hypothetical protein GOV14_02085 [Candidatus Pacearchaeota archaeon]|nr:hypothetical protein [Candidatus Pacearchaeota archaeon]